jgi:hypothetical protein
MAHSAFNPKDGQHDYFRELCSLAAIGELSADEFDELRSHLAGCGECRSLYTDFSRITSSDLSLLFSDTDLHRDLEVNVGPNEKLLLARILDARDRQRITTESPSEPLRIRKSPLGIVLRSAAFRQLMPIAAVVLLAVLGVFGAYRAALHKEAQVIGKLEAEVAAEDVHVRRETDGQRAATQAAEAVQADQAELEAALAKSQEQYAELAARERDEHSALSAAEVKVAELGRQLQSAQAESDQQGKLREESQKGLQAALGELERLRFAQEQTQARLREQERTISDLNSRLKKASDPAEPAAADVDLAKLFGARDLHIVDVYDVDSDGKSRRTYGRVYYAEKKLLVFYAFDLQDKKHNRAAAGFQAWGYREPNASKPENLGLFYVDDPVFNRWVLKVNDAKILQRIDAVFVTLEPSGGSPAPRGRKILYASLAGAANHP